MRDIEKGIKEDILKLGASILEVVIKINGTGYRGCRIKCPCGKKKKFVGNRNKKVVTLLSEIEITRAYYHCNGCGESLIPLDRKLDIENTSISPGVKEAIAMVGAELPFERASELLREIGNVSVGKQKTEQISEEMGLGIERQTEEEQKKYWETEEVEEMKDIPPPEYLYISADGTCVNTEEGWKEVKSGVVFSARNGLEGPVREKTTYIGSFENSEEFGKRLYLEAYKSGLEKAKEVISIGDGAKWIWNETQTHFGKVTEIVDWYHATERIWDIGRMIYKNDTEGLKKWVNPRLEYLKNGRVEKLIRTLNHMGTVDKDLKIKLKDAIGYYENNKARMRYKEFKKRGYFIGSGVVEASCKHVIGDRLKKSGMRWSVKGANAILQLRICFLNNEWDSFWDKHKFYCQ